MLMNQSVEIEQDTESFAEAMLTMIHLASIVGFSVWAIFA